MVNYTLLVKRDINRITVEFKVVKFYYYYFRFLILIGAQWNLKCHFLSLPLPLPAASILYINRITVEFKGKFIYRYINTNTILIESQWNLKKTHVIRLVAMHFDINRITVKFKGWYPPVVPVYKDSVVKTKSNIFIMNWYG